MECQTIYSINIVTLLTAYEHEEYADVLGRASLTLADGIGAVWIIKQLTGKQPERVPGVDLIRDLVAVCAEEGQGIFLLGGREGVARRCAGQLQAEFPSARIAGIRHGFWEPDGEDEIVREVNESRAGLLLVGLGQPRQEFFLDRIAGRLKVRVAMGVGGSFDVISGDLRRAPKWMQLFGLEWLFRIMLQPWRLKRLLGVPKLLWLAWRQRKSKTGKVNA